MYSKANAKIHFSTTYTSRKKNTFQLIFISLNSAFTLKSGFLWTLKQKSEKQVQVSIIQFKRNLGTQKPTGQFTSLFLCLPNTHRCKIMQRYLQAILICWNTQQKHPQLHITFQSGHNHGNHCQVYVKYHLFIRQPNSDLMLLKCLNYTTGLIYNFPTLYTPSLSSYIYTGIEQVRQSVSQSVQSVRLPPPEGGKI